jgi:hypothetical protein
MNVTRLIARGVVLAGIVVSALGVIGAFAQIGYVSRTPLAYAEQNAIPLVISIVVFLVGMWFEVLAAALLGLGALAFIVWGLVGGWDLGIWSMMVFFLIGPMLLSGVLYLFASQTQRVCELEETTSAREATAIS